MHRGKDGQKLLAADLDSQIQQKFGEFDVLAVTGRTILDTDHHLAQMVSRNASADLELFC